MASNRWACRSPWPSMCPPCIPRGFVPMQDFTLHQILSHEPDENRKVDHYHPDEQKANGLPADWKDVSLEQRFQPVSGQHLKKLSTDRSANSEGIKTNPSRRTSSFSTGVTKRLPEGMLSFLTSCKCTRYCFLMNLPDSNLSWLMVCVLTLTMFLMPYFSSRADSLSWSVVTPSWMLLKL